MSTREPLTYSKNMTKRDKENQLTVHIQLDFDMLAALDRIASATGIRKRAGTIRYLIAERARRDREQERGRQNYE